MSITEGVHIEICNAIFEYCPPCPVWRRGTIYFTLSGNTLVSEHIQHKCVKMGLARYDIRGMKHKVDLVEGVLSDDM